MPATVCPHCGAILNGKTCHDKFGEMLALEFEDPEVFGAVHHITVICYNLQHPDGFSEEALAWMRSSLRAIVREGLSGPDLLARARKGLPGKVKIDRHAMLQEPSGMVRWYMTAADVRTDRPEAYVDDVIAWAKSILADLHIA